MKPYAEFGFEILLYHIANIRILQEKKTADPSVKLEKYQVNLGT